MRTRCLCEICTCGRHHCPAGPTRIYEHSGLSWPSTEYLDKYPPHGSVPLPQSLRPKPGAPAPRGRMEGVTTFKADYLPHEPVRPCRREAARYQPPGGAVEQDTTYRRDFDVQHAPPVERVRAPHTRHKKEGKVDTVPTYQADYRPWTPQRRGLCRPQPAYVPPAGSFGNPTTCQDHYPPHQAQAPRGRSCRPLSATLRPTQPFQGTTSHQSDYVAHQPQPQPARPREAYRPSSQPLQDLTTHRLNFQGLPGTAAQPCRPALTRASPGRFSGSTEFQDSFLPWEVPAPRPKKVAEYLAPEGSMEATSTSHLDFVRKCAPRAAPIRPLSQRRSGRPPFQAQSTAQEDFLAWEGQRPSLVRRQPQLPCAQGKFEGLSTSRCHFVPHAPAPVRVHRPPPQPRRSPAAFPQGTTYSLHFTPKRPQACPAAQPEPPGYVFQTTDSRGHRLFLPAAMVTVAEAC